MSATKRIRYHGKYPAQDDDDDDVRGSPCVILSPVVERSSGAVPE